MSGSRSSGTTFGLLLTTCGLDVWERGAEDRDAMVGMMPVRMFVVVGIAVLAFANAAAATGPRCVTAAAPPSGSTGLRTPWGDPDLQGVWSGTELIGVPLDRDPALGTRNVLTDEEFQARRARLLESASSDNIEATNFGAEPELAATRSRQASLVVDPPNGRRPLRTAAAEARQPARNSFSAGPFNSVADLGTYDRCIAYSTVPAALPTNGVHIVQGPGYVAIRTEVIHEARIIPLDGRPHVSASIKSYMGDSRGRWEGLPNILTAARAQEKGAGGPQELAQPRRPPSTRPEPASRTPKPRRPD